MPVVTYKFHKDLQNDVDIFIIIRTKFIIKVSFQENWNIPNVPPDVLACWRFGCTRILVEPVALCGSQTSPISNGTLPLFSIWSALMVLILVSLIVSTGVSTDLKVPFWVGLSCCFSFFHFRWSSYPVDKITSSPNKAVNTLAIEKFFYLLNWSFIWWCPVCLQSFEKVINLTSVLVWQKIG